MISCTKIRVDGKYVVFTLSNGSEYDPSLHETEQSWWLDHMREKNWFTKAVEEKTKIILADYLQ